MTDDKLRSQNAPVGDNSDPLGLADGIRNAKKLLAERGRKVSSKALKDAEDVASFAQGLGLNGGTFRKTLAVHEKNRQEIESSESSPEPIVHESEQAHIPSQDTHSSGISTMSSTDISTIPSADNKAIRPTDHLADIRADKLADTSADTPTDTLANIPTAASTNTSTDTLADTLADNSTDASAVTQTHASADYSANTLTDTSTGASADYSADTPAVVSTNHSTDTPAVAAANTTTITSTDTSTDITSGKQTTQQTAQQHEKQTNQQTEGHAGSSTKSSTKPSTTTSTNTPVKAAPRSRWDAPKTLRGLNKTDLIILAHIVERDPLTTTIDTIAHFTRIPRGTTRSCLYRLKERKLLTWERVYDGSAVGTAYTLFDHTTALFETHKTYIYQEIAGAVSPSLTAAASDPGHMVADLQYPQQHVQQSPRQMGQQNHQQTFQQTPEQTNPSLDRKIKENLSILEELEKEAKRLYRLDDEDMQMFLPDLYRAGFTAVNVRSLIERRHKNGLDLSDPTAKMIHMGMRRADAALRIGEGTFKGTINTPIENVPGYVFSTLLKDASFPKPNGWEPEEVVAQQLELERLRQEAERQRLESEMRNKIEAGAKAEREEQDYQAWRNALAPEEIAAYRDRCPNKKSEESLERFLRVEWRKTLG